MSILRPPPPQNRAVLTPSPSPNSLQYFSSEPQLSGGTDNEARCTPDHTCLPCGKGDFYAFEAIKKNSFCHCPTSLTVSDLESSAVFLPPSAPQERLQTRHSIEGAGESDPAPLRRCERRNVGTVAHWHNQHDISAGLISGGTLYNTYPCLKGLLIINLH